MLELIQPDISATDKWHTQEHWWQMGPLPGKLLPSLQPPDGQAAAALASLLPRKRLKWKREDRDRHSLFGQLSTGLQKEMVEGRVLEGEVRGRGGALKVQAADDDVEHCGHRRQLHAVEHRRQLRRDGLHVWLVGVHDCSERKEKAEDHS